MPLAYTEWWVCEYCLAGWLCKSSDNVPLTMCLFIRICWGLICGVQGQVYTKEDGDKKWFYENNTARYTHKLSEHDVTLRTELVDPFTETVYVYEYPIKSSSSRGYRAPKTQGVKDRNILLHLVWLQRIKMRVPSNRLRQMEETPPAWCAINVRLTIVGRISYISAS